MATDRCLVHGNELHFDKRSGFDLCYECEREKPARAEPSRGAPQRVKDFWMEYYKEATPNFLPSEAACQFAEAYAESRHVVLLEALRALVNWCRHPLHGGIQDLPKPLEPYLLRAEAAIQQVEGL